MGARARQGADASSAAGTHGSRAGALAKCAARGPGRFFPRAADLTGTRHARARSLRLAGAGCGDRRGPDCGVLLEGCAGLNMSEAIAAGTGSVASARPVNKWL